MPRPDRDALVQAFRALDLNGDGHINARELREAMVRLDEHLTEGEAEALIAQHDRDGSGAIEIEELVGALLAAAQG